MLQQKKVLILKVSFCKSFIITRTIDVCEESVKDLLVSVWTVWWRDMILLAIKLIYLML